MRRLLFVAIGLAACDNPYATAPPDDAGVIADAGVGAANGDGGSSMTGEAPMMDGGRVVPAVLASGFDSLGGIAATETDVYVTSRDRGLTDIAIDGSGTQSFGPKGSMQPFGIALVGLYVCWFGDDAMIRTLDLTGNSFGPALTVPGLVAIASTPTELATLEATEVALRSVPSLKLDSATMTAQTKPTDLAVFGSDLYYTSSATQTVHHIGADNEEEVIAMGEVGVGFVAADPGGAYWTRQTDIRGYAFNKVTTLAMGEATPVAIASDGIDLYWITIAGELRRRTSSTVETVTSGFEPVTSPNARSLALTSRYIVWLTADGKVLRFDK